MAFLFTTVSLLCGFNGSHSAKSPKDVVLKFCLSDAEGKRLSSDTWTAIMPLITWTDEPGWDTAVVISDFRVINAEVSSVKATVSVKYHILGSVSVDFKKGDTYETEKFELVYVNGTWKIDKPVITPHVYKKAIIKHFREIQKSDSYLRKSWTIS